MSKAVTTYILNTIQPFEGACVFGFPFPRSYHVILFFLSVCFKVLEEVVKYFIWKIYNFWN